MADEMEFLDEDELNALSKLLEEEKEEDMMTDENISSNNQSEQENERSRDTGEEEDILTMKAKMAEMEQQLNELKKLVKSNEKKEIKQENIKMGPRKRVAHQSCGATTPTNKRVRRSVGVTDESCDTEHYTGLRIKNPLISSQVMKERMRGRKMILIPSLYCHINNGQGDIDGDWVTGGIIVHKLPPKDTAKGSKFTVWKLSDLSSQTAVVSLFLFDKVFEEHWKTPLGHVVVILNPKIQTDRETNSTTGVKGQRNYSLSLDHPGKLMSLGVSFDYTCCLATTKSGKPCQNFASKEVGGRCEYHIHGEYSKLKSKRMECQGGFGPKSIDIHTKVLGKMEIFHQGKWFSGDKMKEGKRDRKEEEEMGRGSVRLFAPGARERSNEVEAILGKELAGSCVKKFKDGVRTQTGGEIFKKLLQGQTPGAICYKTFLNKKEEEEIKKESRQSSNEKTALQFLKEQVKTTESEIKSSDTKIKSTQSGVKSTQSGIKSTQSGVKSTDTKIKSTDISNRTSSTDANIKAKVTPPKIETEIRSSTQLDKRKVVATSNSKKVVATSNSKKVVATGNNKKVVATGNSKKVTLANSITDEKPTLSFVDFNFFAPPLPSPLEDKENITLPINSSLEERPPQPIAESAHHLPVLKSLQSLKEKERRMKLRAKEHAKETMRSLCSERDRSRGVLTRLENNLKEEEKVSSKKKENNNSSSLDIDKLEKLLATSSTHQSEVKQDEQKLEEKYFQHLEKKEAIEEKLQQTKELTVRVIKCIECRYIAESAGERCRKEGHALSHLRALKRCFKCNGCGFRIFTYNERYPKKPCNCGENDYKATSLYQVRKGPKLPGEQLSLRGDEQKFINSLK